MVPQLKDNKLKRGDRLWYFAQVHKIYAHNFSTVIFSLLETTSTVPLTKQSVLGTTTQGAA